MLDLSTLNPAQLEAVTAPDGAVLVIAGAGSGKTRTLVYRLAWLAEQGVSPASMLLLTFTRKASREMLHRAADLLGYPLGGVQGGTFHGFAYALLRQYRPAWAKGSVTVMDSSDCASAIQQCKERLRIGKGDRAFPKTQTILGLLSKARNKECSLEEVLQRDATHLLPYGDALAQIGEAYTRYRREHDLLDYDDLLFELEALLREEGHKAAHHRPDSLPESAEASTKADTRSAGEGMPLAQGQGAWSDAGAEEEGGGQEAEATDSEGVRAYRPLRDILRERYQYIMVDEYQDTNRVQARIIRLLAGEHGNVMAVGDDAQSIYAFRGATVRNILDFPKLFPNAQIIRLEENYRSTQPVLDVANAVLAPATEGYRKTLFTQQAHAETPKVQLLRPLSDLSQANLVAGRIESLLEAYQPKDIAVLFRAGYHSYHLEVALSKRQIKFRKYGGLRYAEATHVKDVVAFVRLAINPLDMPSFERVAGLSKGVGIKTAQKIYQVATTGDMDALRVQCTKYPSLWSDMLLLETLRQHHLSPAALLETVIEHYQPRLQQTFPDDWPRRQQGLEELVHIATAYTDLDQFVADLSLESPEESAGEEDEAERVVLSTIHSSKGLEWNAVIVLDLVEDRFPSRHALVRSEDFEEERRLMYVACTRARENLVLSVPTALYNRQHGGNDLANPSPFVRDLPCAILEEWQEHYGGRLIKRAASASSGCTFGSGMPVSVPLQRGTDAGRAAASPVGHAVKPSLAVPAQQGHMGQPQRGQSEGQGYCRHKVFGRGKIVEQLPPDKCRVNFPGFGLKVILTAYLSLEE